MRCSKVRFWRTCRESTIEASLTSLWEGGWLSLKSTGGNGRETSEVYQGVWRGLSSNEVGYKRDDCRSTRR